VAGHVRYTALLDACVLYPTTVADVLMSLAVPGLFAAKWSEAIEAEWMRNLEKNRPELAGKLDRRRDFMRSFASACAATQDALDVAIALVEQDVRRT
jgi:hypothetical protein